MYYSEKFKCDMPSYRESRMKSTVMSFWQRVYEIQCRKDMDIYEMAHWAGIDEEEYTELQKSGREPDLNTAVGIAAGLGVSVEYLVTGNSYNVYKDRCENLCKKLNEIHKELMKVQSQVSEAILEEQSASIDAEINQSED